MSSDAECEETLVESMKKTNLADDCDEEVDISNNETSDEFYIEKSIDLAIAAKEDGNNFFRNKDF